MPEHWIPRVGDRVKASKIGHSRCDTRGLQEGEIIWVFDDMMATIFWYHDYGTGRVGLTWHLDCVERL